MRPGFIAGSEKLDQRETLFTQQIPVIRIKMDTGDPFAFFLGKVASM
jgi:hypothetical protein